MIAISRRHLSLSAVITLFITVQICLAVVTIVNKKAVLSQEEPRYAVVNFDTYRNLQHHRAAFSV